MVIAAIKGHYFYGSIWMELNGDMAVGYRVLVVEDNAVNAEQLLRLLNNAGYQTDWAKDGLEALVMLRKSQYAAVLTDWMMPKLDGPGLIRKMDEMIRPRPITMMVTILNSPEARRHALDVIGADAYVQKPYQAIEILQTLEMALNKVRDQQTALPASPHIVQKPQVTYSKVAFPLVGIAASTGGPVFVRYLIEELRGVLPRTAILVVQHGPVWMLESFVEMVQSELKVPCILGKNEIPLEKGNVYVAPGERHMVVAPTGDRILITDTPAENFCKPAADPLFRSLSAVGGRQVISVVLTGLGRDGGQGACAIAENGGCVIVQDPDTCAAPFMPRTVISLGAAHHVLSPEKIPPAIEKNLQALARR